jgi:hypothetical protein
LSAGTCANDGKLSGFWFRNEGDAKALASSLARDGPTLHHQGMAMHVAITRQFRDTLEAILPCVWLKLDHYQGRPVARFVGEKTDLLPIPKTDGDDFAKIAQITFAELRESCDFPRNQKTL